MARLVLGYQVTMSSGEVEKMGKRVINEAELKEIQSKLAMESDVMNKCTQNLLTTLLQYVKGDAQSEGYVRWDERSDRVVPIHRSQGS